MLRAVSQLRAELQHQSTSVPRLTIQNGNKKNKQHNSSQYTSCTPVKEDHLDVRLDERAKNQYKRDILALFQIKRTLEWWSHLHHQVDSSLNTPSPDDFIQDRTPDFYRSMQTQSRDGETDVYGCVTNFCENVLENANGDISNMETTDAAVLELCYVGDEEDDENLVKAKTFEWSNNVMKTNKRSEQQWPNIFLQRLAEAAEVFRRRLLLTHRSDERQKRVMEQALLELYGTRQLLGIHIDLLLRPRRFSDENKRRLAVLNAVVNKIRMATTKQNKDVNEGNNAGKKDDNPCNEQDQPQSVSLETEVQIFLQKTKHDESMFNPEVDNKDNASRQPQLQRTILSRKQEFDNEFSWNSGRDAVEFKLLAPRKNYSFDFVDGAMEMAKRVQATPIRRTAGKGEPEVYSILENLGRSDSNLTNSVQSSLSPKHQQLDSQGKIKAKRAKTKRKTTSKNTVEMKHEGDSNDIGSNQKQQQRKGKKQSTTQTQPKDQSSLPRQQPQQQQQQQQQQQRAKKQQQLSIETSASALATTPQARSFLIKSGLGQDSLMLSPKPGNRLNDVRTPGSRGSWKRGSVSTPNLGSKDGRKSKDEDHSSVESELYIEGDSDAEVDESMLDITQNAFLDSAAIAEAAAILAASRIGQGDKAKTRLSKYMEYVGGNGQDWNVSGSYRVARGTAITTTTSGNAILSRHVHLKNNRWAKDKQPTIANENEARSPMHKEEVSFDESSGSQIENKSSTAEGDTAEDMEEDDDDDEGIAHGINPKIYLGPWQFSAIQRSIVADANVIRQKNQILVGKGNALSSLIKHRR